MYNMHAISALVSHLVPSDLILTSPESCKISATSGPYFLAKNWCIVTSLNPMPSVFCLQANMYIDTHQWLNLHFSPPITSEKDDLRQFNSGFTKRLSINEDLRTRKATYQFPGEWVSEPESTRYRVLLTTRAEISGNLWTFLEGYLHVQKKQGRRNKVFLSMKVMLMKVETLKLSNNKYS